MIPAEECWWKSLTPLMAEIRAKIGDAPVYLSYEIYSLDPAFAPGTGTVEVSPPYDPSGNIALIWANLL